MLDSYLKTDSRECIVIVTWTTEEECILNISKNELRNEVHWIPTLANVPDKQAGVYDPYFYRIHLRERWIGK